MSNKTGIELIAEERQRQIKVKKYDAEHDSYETAFELSAADLNKQDLIRQGKLWFFPDGSMYVYYTPTHWRKKQKQ